MTHELHLDGAHLNRAVSLSACPVDYRHHASQSHRRPAPFWWLTLRCCWAESLILTAVVAVAGFVWHSVAWVVIKVSFSLAVSSAPLRLHTREGEEEAKKEEREREANERMENWMMRWNLFFSFFFFVNKTQIVENATTGFHPEMPVSLPSSSWTLRPADRDDKSSMVESIAKLLFIIFAAAAIELFIYFFSSCLWVEMMKLHATQRSRGRAWWWRWTLCCGRIWGDSMQVNASGAN